MSAASRRPRGALARRAARLLAPHRVSIAGVGLLTLAVAAAYALEPLLFRRVVDALGSGSAWGGVLLGTCALLGLGFAAEAMQSVSNCLTWRLRLRLQAELLDVAAAHLYRLPMSFHQAEGVGGLTARMQRSVDGVVGAVGELASNVLPSAAYLAFSAVVMVRLDWRLTLVVVAFTVAPVALSAPAAEAQARRERHLTRRWSRIYARLHATLAGVLTVKCHAREEAERSRFVRRVREANRVVAAGVAFDARVGAGKTCAMQLARAGVLLVGALLLRRGGTSLGTIVAFLGYACGVFGPVHGLTGAYELLRRAAVALETLFEIVDMDDPGRDAPDAVEVVAVRGEVRFDGVEFAYVPGRPVLRGVDLHVRPGERIAIVGPSGTGKSTLVWLLLRLYQPTRGTVEVDGVDLRRVQQQSLRRHVGVVVQETVLFEGSIRANIAYARPHASREEIEAAARAANADEFIRRLPRGYETRVGERGVGLSAGERQRIAIARVLLQDPAIVVLDEATSNLDGRSESLVREALERATCRRTTFVISHRPAMSTAADRVVVLSEGRIVELGTDEQLAAG